jgi:hypothetical protein
MVMNLADTKSLSDDIQSFEHPADDGMLYVPGGTYRMGSDRHYPEEAPIHRVSVNEFWMDRTPVTNRVFRKFVNATGYVTFAELTPDAKDYPDALPHMLKAGSLVFTPPKQAVDLRNWGQWWTFKFGANWRRPYGPRSNISGLDEHPVVHVAYRDVEAYARWAGKALPTEAEMGIRRTRRTGRRGIRLGRPAISWRQAHGEHMAGQFSAPESCDRWLPAHFARHCIPGQRLRPARHYRQCLGMDVLLVLAET